MRARIYIISPVSLSPLISICCPEPELRHRPHVNHPKYISILGIYSDAVTPVFFRCHQNHLLYRKISKEVGRWVDSRSYTIPLSMLIHSERQGLLHLFILIIVHGLQDYRSHGLYPGCRRCGLIIHGNDWEIWLWDVRHYDADACMARLR